MEGTQYFPPLDLRAPLVIPGLHDGTGGHGLGGAGKVGAVNSIKHAAVADVDPHDGGEVFGLDLVVANRTALRTCWQQPALKAAELSRSDKKKEAKSSANTSKPSASNPKQTFLQRQLQQQYGSKRHTALPMGRIGLALHQSESNGQHHLPQTNSWPTMAALFGSTAWSTSPGGYLMVRGPVGMCGSGFEFRRTVDSPCRAGDFDGGNVIGTDDVLVGDEVVCIGHVSAVGLCPAAAESLVETLLLNPVEKTFSHAKNAENGDAKTKAAGHAFRVLLRRRKPLWNEWWQQVRYFVNWLCC